MKFITYVDSKNYIFSVSTESIQFTNNVLITVLLIWWQKAPH